MKPEVQAAVDKLIASYGDVKREAKSIQPDKTPNKQRFLLQPRCFNVVGVLCRSVFARPHG